jgi:hypothetical protein
VIDVLVTPGAVAPPPPPPLEPPLPDDDEDEPQPAITSAATTATAAVAAIRFLRISISSSWWNGERRHFDTSSPERFKYYGFQLGVATD